MSTVVYQDGKCRVVVRWASHQYEVLAEESSGKDSMDNPKFRPAKTKGELQRVLSAVALSIHEQQGREFDRLHPRGGPDDR